MSTEPGRWKARGLAHHEQKSLDDESEKKNQKSFFTTWQPEIRQSRQTAKRSYPPSNPIPAVTGGGVGKGSDFRTRTRTRVTRDRDTAV